MVTLNQSYLILDFVTQLQNDFPSTVSTITRTVSKLDTGATSASERCRLCFNFMQSGSHEWNATHTIYTLESGEAKDGKLNYTDLCYSCLTIQKEIKL